MGSFLSGIFTGSNPTLGGDIGNAGNIMGFGTSVGEGDIGAASGFYNTLLGGNQAQEAQLLAPEISNIAGQANQKTQTNAEFGNRSGGTNASNQNTMDTARANVNNMVSQLTGSAASGLAGIGENALNTGLNANQVQSNESQEQLQNQQNSLLGGIISKGVSGGLGLVPGLGGIF